MTPRCTTPLRTQAFRYHSLNVHWHCYVFSPKSQTQLYATLLHKSHWEILQSYRPQSVGNLCTSVSSKIQSHFVTKVSQMVYDSTRLRLWFCSCSNWKLAPLVVGCKSQTTLTTVSLLDWFHLLGKDQENLHRSQPSRLQQNNPMNITPNSFIRNF